MANIQENSALSRKQILKFVSDRRKSKLLDAYINHPLNNSYRKSFVCSKVMKKAPDKDKLTSIYCKQRWCDHCNAIKSAIFIEKYSQPIQELNKPYFVTLTRKSVLDDYLADQLSTIYSIWRNIAKKAKKAKFKREIGSFKGIRKLEVTLRPEGRVHAHLHLIIEGKKQSDWLINEWLERSTMKYANPKAQDMRPVNENAIVEMAKYATKMSVKGDSGTDYKRLSTLYYKLKGKRTFQPFGGFKGLNSVDEEDFDKELNSQTLDRVLADDYYKWFHSLSDWVGNETGELLSGKEIPEEIRKEWE